MKIPPRPFFRTTIEEQNEEWAKIFNGLYKRYFKGSQTSEQVLNLVGAKVSSDVQDKISEIHAPELRPVTIALRRLRDDGKKITGATVGAVARAIDAGETAFGQLGDQTFENKKPLNESGYMMATLTYNVKTG